MEIESVERLREIASDNNLIQDELNDIADELFKLHMDSFAVCAFMNDFNLNDKGRLDAIRRVMLEEDI